MGDTSTKPSLLVTVGSTLFPNLTDAVLSAPVLELLADHISTLRVQLGRAKFPIGLNELLASPPGEQQGNEESLTGKYKGMEVQIFRFTSDFEGLVNTSDLVVSHAGSGSILTTLRAGKPLLVVPNVDLMDNHQGQLAGELEKGGYLHVSDIHNLRDSLDQFVTRGNKGITPFPAFEPSRFRGIMDEMMGFNEDHL